MAKQSQAKDEVKVQTTKKLKKYRSVSRFIEIFEYKGKLYTIKPNSVVENLPDISQVKRLVRQGKLVEAK